MKGRTEQFLQAVSTVSPGAVESRSFDKRVINPFGV